MLCSIESLIIRTAVRLTSDHLYTPPIESPRFKKLQRAGRVETFKWGTAVSKKMRTVRTVPSTLYLSFSTHSFSPGRFDLRLDLCPWLQAPHACRSSRRRKDLRRALRRGCRDCHRGTAFHTPCALFLKLGRAVGIHLHDTLTPVQQPMRQTWGESHRQVELAVGIHVKRALVSE